jgi:hypothetical protein
LGRETDIWEALSERWGIQGIDAGLYQSTLVRSHGLEVHSEVQASRCTKHVLQQIQLCGVQQAQFCKNGRRMA